MIEKTIKTVGMVLVDGFSLMALSSAIEPLRAANKLSGKELYDISFICADRDSSVSSAGLFSNGKSLKDAGHDYDLVLVAAAGTPATYENPALFRYLKTLASKRVRLGGISGGSVLLARAGLMKNKRFTVHWDHYAALAEMTDPFLLERNIYVIDQDRYTCAGGVAPMDMMSAIISADHGRELAKQVNDWFIYTSVRKATEPQRMGLVEKYQVHHPAVICAIELMQNHLSDPLSSKQIALLSDIGERQLSRLFQQYLGKKINQFYADMRLEHAHILIKQTSLPVIEIALASGYESAAYFSQKFRAHFGYSPTQYRKQQLR
jgi:transcriptional regulator GlxA family with amidase domain